MTEERKPRIYHIGSVRKDSSRSFSEEFTAEQVYPDKGVQTGAAAQETASAVDYHSVRVHQHGEKSWSIRSAKNPEDKFSIPIAEDEPYEALAEQVSRHAESEGTTIWKRLIDTVFRRRKPKDISIWVH
jgi:hypothetical protein